MEARGVWLLPDCDRPCRWNSWLGGHGNQRTEIKRPVRPWPSRKFLTGPAPPRRSVCALAAVSLPVTQP